MTPSQKKDAAPRGWIIAGSHPAEYFMGIESTIRHFGTKCAWIKSIGDKMNGFGTLMQVFVPGAYAGKRVRLSGWIKTADVDNQAGLWMRVDGPEQGKHLAFDNMGNRPIIGTRDWAKYEVILQNTKSYST
jgi:hypothetical protein